MIYGRRALGTIAYMGGVLAVAEEFCWSLAQMTEYNSTYLCDPHEFIHYDRVKISYHSTARNYLVQTMKGDWLLQLDTDHRFDPDLCGRMLHVMNKHDIDVLSGIYLYKDHPNAPTIYHWDGRNHAPIVNWDAKAEIFQIGSAGGGCLLVRKKVYERINNELKERPFDIIGQFSEDHSFFHRLRTLAIPAYCCPFIESEHLAIRPVGLKDHSARLDYAGETKPTKGRLIS